MRDFVGKSVFVVLVLILCPMFNAAYGQNSLELDFGFSLTMEEISFNKINGYDNILIEHAAYTSGVGEPMIPAVAIRVALPEGMKAVDIEVLNYSSSELIGQYDICPMQPIAKIGHNDLPFAKPNAEFYNSSKLYPSKIAELVGQTDLAGQAMAVVRLYPIHYIASEKKLVLYDQINFRLKCEPGYICGDYLPVNYSSEKREEIISQLEQEVINPEAVQVRPGNNNSVITGVSAGDYDYVIISSSVYANYFQPLCDWKNKKGIRATIVTTDWIYNSGGYSGTNQDKIQLFVRDANSTWGASYFLIGGDTNIIPAHSRYLDDEYVANDTYYADFDDDWTCEVHVGRAPVRNASEINVFIDKVLTYEKNPPLSDYQLKAAQFGFDLDSSTPGEDCMEYIENYYIPSGWDVTNVFDSQVGAHEQATKNAMNAGQNLVNHIDHCNAYYLGTGSVNHDDGWSTSEVDAFYNGDYQCIFYTLGCHANAFDENTSISEHMMKDTNGGSVGYVGNSRNGLYYSGNTNSLSFEFDKYFFRSLFQQGHYKLGACFSDHKNDAVVITESQRYLFTGLTLLGDPEMPIWTGEPDEIVIDHPEELPVGQSSFTVHVENGSGANLYQAYVCLYKDGEVYLTGSTNSSGNFTFYPEPATVGSMFVTATKQNFIPAESQASVIDPQGAVSGYVYNIDLEPVPGVVISCISQSLDTTSGADGAYLLYGFDDGTYNITFSHPQYQDTTVTGVYVTIGHTTALDVTLNPYANDVGVTSIFDPGDTIMMATPSPVRCEVRNFGTNANSFEVHFEARPIHATTAEFTTSYTITNLPGGAIDTIEFDTYFEPELDTLYAMRAYTTLDGDMYSPNNATNDTCRNIQGITVWYGNLDRSPVTAYLGSRLEIDVYVQTSPDIYAADIHLCLGAMTEYIDTLISETEDNFYSPISEWVNTEFFGYQIDPNPPGWGSQSFWGVVRLARLGATSPLEDTPWLHLPTPTKILSFVAETSEDSSLVGQIVECFGPGWNDPQGPSNAGDSMGMVPFMLTEYYSPVMFRSPYGDCDYMPGDVNSDGHVVGGDVTYLVNYFRGVGNPPPDSCWNDLAGRWLYSAADPNGDCNVVGGDVTYLVNYFRGLQPGILWCPETPPIGEYLLDNSKIYKPFEEIPGTE